MLWWTFMDPAARTVLIEWEAEASAQLGPRDQARLSELLGASDGDATDAPL